MRRVNAIVRHPLYREYYGKLALREQDRIFCRHQMEHLLAVARIAYIHNLERRLGFSKELIYAIAVLHDIGKYEQYENRTPHEIAGVRIAERILREINEDSTDIFFEEEEICQILKAIKNHRRREDAEDTLDALFYESDKQSRDCFACPAEKQCDWEEEKKNKEILI